MTNEEMSAFIKGLMTSDNAEQCSAFLNSIQEKDTQIEALKTENSKLKDKVVEMAFRTPVKKEEKEGDIEPPRSDPISVDEALAQWAELNLQEK